MTSIADRRREIINHLWTYTTTDAKRSPAFLKYLEEVIKQDRAELILELQSEIDKVGTYYEAVQVINQFKIK